MEILPQTIALGTIFLLVAAPHGGRYPLPRRPAPRPPVYGGPSDGMPRQPPAPGAPSGRSGSPTGPGAPSPAGPGPAGAPAPVGAGRGPTTPRGITIEPDFTSWDYWWEFNQHAYLQLKEAVYRGQQTGSDDFFLGARRRGLGGNDDLRPSDADLRNRVLPALRAALALPDQRDISTSALIALAKTDVAEADDLAAIRRRLGSSLPVLRETAALALGLAGRTEPIDDLIALATDSPAGRKLCRLATVDYRLRSFSVYALALIGRAHADVALKARILATVQPMLADSRLRWDIKLAAIHALRLLQPHGPRSYHREKLLYGCLDVLWAYYRADLGRGERVVQCHVPTAIAGVLGRGGDRTGRFLRAFAAELQTETTHRAVFAQSCALALGAMATPDDTEVCAALRHCYERGKDHQARFFCLVALGRIGGEANRTALLGYLAHGNKALEKPWAAVALGLLARAASIGDPGAPADQTIGRALRAELANNRNDLARAAYAVALGLARYRNAADDLLAALRRNEARDPLAGYLCLGLALMGENRAIPEIRALIEKGRNRPGLVVQGATALAVLGDKTAQSELTTNLEEGEPSLLHLAANAQALASVGDRRSIDVLLKLAADRSRPRIARGYALVGLGGVADRDAMPWHAPLAADLNYRAVLETLLDGTEGVLDIL